MLRLLSRGRRDIVCRDAVALVTDYLEGALSARDRTRLERHLAGCTGCEEYFREMRITISTLGRVEPEDLTPEARSEMVALLLRFRADDGGDAWGNGDGA